MIDDSRRNEIEYAECMRHITKEWIELRMAKQEKTKADKLTKELKRFYAEYYKIIEDLKNAK